MKGAAGGGEEVERTGGGSMRQRDLLLSRSVKLNYYYPHYH